MRGLRVRLALALLATSLITLLVAVLALVPPIESRLERDRFGDLRQLTRTARLSVQRLPERRLEPGSRAVRNVVVDLQRRTGGQVMLFDAAGRVLADTTPTPPISGPDELARLQAARLTRRGDVRQGLLGGAAVVVSGVQRPEGDHLTLVIRKPLDDTRAAASVVRRAVFPATVAGALAALLLALGVSRGLLQRLRRLRDDARSLRDEGLGHEVRVGPADEVGEVAAALESMRSRLVAEDAARRTFLTTASHELRTPLATLQGNLELLVEELDGVTGPPARERADAALRTTHQLVGLATDLLDLDRVGNDARLTLEPLELVEMAHAAVAEIADRAAAAGRSVTVSGAPPVYALADATAVMRVLRVLLDNACGHGGGPIEVSLTQEDQRALLRVSDQGEGLPAEDRERVFLPFERGSRAGLAPGFGLGLPLARGLAERMDGSLRARETGPGAALELRLPSWAAGAPGSDIQLVQAPVGPAAG